MKENCLIPSKSEIFSKEKNNLNQLIEKTNYLSESDNQICFYIIFFNAKFHIAGVERHPAAGDKNWL